VAFKGRLSRGLDEERLRRMLSAVLLRPHPARDRWRRVTAAAGPAQPAEPPLQEFEDDA